MIEKVTPRGRILAAALDCAARKSWPDVTLLDIAETAELPLADLRREFETKSRIIAALVRTIDDEVLKRVPRRAETQEPRDALFDVIMTRFDVLAPHKRALKSIYDSGTTDLGMARPVLMSMHWMLQAAGIGSDGYTGQLRIMGLASVYASVFRVWLDDDDPGHARTMAALDRRLRRGERFMRGIEDASNALNRLATEGPEFLRSAFRGRRTTAEPRPDSEAGPV